MDVLVSVVFFLLLIALCRREKKFAPWSREGGRQLRVRKLTSAASWISRCISATTSHQITSPKVKI
jgi:hypothetical protein